jgi:hypothetical protein
MEAGCFISISEKVENYANELQKKNRFKILALADNNMEDLRKFGG